jgi:uncharacterized membrane protein YhaH (DUF805 family)
MDSEQHKYWFRAKRHGWGWGLPATWQGWLVLTTWMAAVLTLSPLLAARNITLFYLFIVGMAAAIIAVCYVKGEPPRWRWGEDREK